MAQTVRGKRTLNDLLDVLGIRVSGDLGPLTCYTSRQGKLVSYPRSPPTCPPSPAQITQRARFTNAQGWWGRLDQATKAAWETLTRANDLCLTGQNLAIALAFNPDAAALATANKRAGTSLSLPPPV